MFTKEKNVVLWIRKCLDPFLKKLIIGTNLEDQLVLLLNSRIV